MTLLQKGLDKIGKNLTLWVEGIKLQSGGREACSKKINAISSRI